jgi:hypothetical protein
MRPRNMPRFDIRLQGSRAEWRRFGDDWCAGWAELQVRTALVGLRPTERREQSRQQDSEVDEYEACEQRYTGADGNQRVLYEQWKRERRQGLEVQGLFSISASTGWPIRLYQHVPGR